MGVTTRLIINIDSGSKGCCYQFIQFDTVVNAPGIEIAWNRIDNDPGNSSVEDNITDFNTSGTASSPLVMHDNLVHGAYPKDLSDNSYSGGGVLLGDGGGGNAIMRNNVIVSSANYGICIAGGQNETVAGNIVVSAGHLPDGSSMPSNVGACVWNQYSAPFGNAQLYDNTIGYSHADGSRNDAWLPDCSGKCSNFSLHSGAITTADENAAIAEWVTRAANAGVTVGLTGDTSPTPTPSATPTPTPTPPALTGDLDSNGKVDIFDLSVLLLAWGKTGAADLNHNGVVNVFDLSILLSHWTG